VKAIPIANGTNRQASIGVGRFRVSDVGFGCDQLLPWHAHPSGCVAVVLEGAVRKEFARKGTVAAAGTLVTMPPEEAHSDLFGREGARIVVVEASEGIESVAYFRSWAAVQLGLRIAKELVSRDSFTPLAVEGLALELAAIAGRGAAPPRPEKWLEAALELLRERPPELPSVREIAAAVGVHPRRLARDFRSHYGESLGECARRLRLEWAADRLVHTDVGLACLAFQAGFVDQSHFTRAFKRQFALTPGRYRAAHR
jgi:AraC family transcriptional regulator